MWVKFNRDYLWTGKDRRWSIEFKASGGDAGRYSVTRAQGADAIEAGAAIECANPRRNQSKADASDEVAEQGEGAAETPGAAEGSPQTHRG